MNKIIVFGFITIASLLVVILIIYHFVIYDYHKTYYESGALKEKYRTHKGKLDGFYLRYTENGVMECQLSYIGGEKQGLQYFYHSNGKKKEMFDVTEPLSFSFKSYSQNGIVLSEGVVEHGKRVGDWRYYYDNGKVKAEGCYKDGHKTGEWNYFNQEATLERSTVWNIQKDKMGLFAINVPDNWLVNKDQDQILLLTYPEQETLPINLSIVKLMNVQKGQKLETIFQLNYSSLSEDLGEKAQLTIDTIGEASINGHNAYQALYFIDTNKRTIVNQFFIEKEETVYLLTFSVSDGCVVCYDLSEEIAHSFM
jgi:antitoxin component YwqK of YwqJK toxin-antitoxin module